MPKWYVIQTATGSEQRVVDKIVAAVPEELIEEICIPSYARQKHVRGSWVEVRETLFPGYIFVNTRDALALHEALRSVLDFTRILRNDEMFLPLDEQGLMFLTSFTEKGNRSIEMSHGIIEGDEVIIFDGPLRGRSALIEKIDRHKRLAYLALSFLGRTIKVKVGLEIIAKA